MVIGPNFYLEIPLFARKCPENGKILVDRYALYVYLLAAQLVHMASKARLLCLQYTWLD